MKQCACRVDIRSEANNAEIDKLCSEFDCLGDLVFKTIEPRSQSLDKTFAETVKKFKSSLEAVVNVAQKVVRKKERDLKERKDKNLIIFEIAEADRENIRAVVGKLLQECSIKKTNNFDNIFRLEQLNKNNSTN